MKRKAVGFYWTLPVPWVRFTALSDDIEEAAQQSRTIRYQCTLIRGWARDNGYKLVQEKVFIEIEPDRGSEFVLPPLEELAAHARQTDATLLYADFGEVLGWRSHFVMDTWVERQQLDHVPISPDPVMIDGREFDPAEHFAAWRQRQKKWIAGKPERTAAALSRALELRAAGLTQTAVVQALNAECFMSSTGKPWTADNLRKLLKKADLH